MISGVKLPLTTSTEPVASGVVVVGEEVAVGEILMVGVGGLRVAVGVGVADFGWVGSGVIAVGVGETLAA